MEKNLNYRKAYLDDVGRLVELRKKQLIDEGCYADNNIDKELQKYFSDSIANESLVVWIAEKLGEIIATAGVCFFQYPPSYSNPTGMIAYVTNVYTKLEYRKQGIASGLLEYIMDEIESKGCRFARLHSSDQGRGIYEKMGFVNADGFMVKRMKK